MTELAPTRPEFAASIRGYDRMQVENYVDRLQSLLAEAEERTRAAEAELEFSRHATVGPRVAQIFDLAVEESKELRERIKGETENALLRLFTNAYMFRPGGMKAMPGQRNLPALYRWLAWL